MLIKICLKIHSNKKYLIKPLEQQNNNQIKKINEIKLFR
jgi:hypothetical protein